MAGGLRVAWVGAIVASLFVAGSAQASPEDLFGYGARTSAMGATGTAHATGYETAWSNPALASRTRAQSLTLGVLAANMRLDAKGEGLAGRTPVDPVRGVVVGAALPVPFGGVLARRVGLSLGLYTPTDLVVRGRVLHPEKTQFPVLADRAQSLALRVGLGVDVGHGFRAGLGVAALAELTGRVVAATDATGRVGTRVETQLVATYAPAFGLSWETPLPSGSDPATLRLGLVARGALDARFGVVIDGTKLSSLAIPRFDIGGVAQYDPAQIALEAAREDEDTTLALQLVGKHWSAFPGFLSPTVVCGDATEDSCGITPPAIDFRDTIALRAGGERRFALARRASFFARAGAGFETSPLPDTLPTSEAYVRGAGVTTVPTAYFDASRVVGTVGAGVGLDGALPISIDVFAALHHLLPRTMRSVEADGTTRLAGEGSGTIGVFGASAGVRF